MDSHRWEKVQALFHEAADLPGDAQQVFLKTACGDDGALLADLSAMLEEDARSNSLLDRGMADVAHEMLAGGEPETLPHQDFGPYSIKKIIGEGGMGVVFLAERSDLGSLVAIKILRDAWVSPARRERFASEQRTLAQLNHPSIARLYDADMLADGTPWFAMEYVEGTHLTSYCSQNACSIAERLQLFRAVCEAVQYAHQQAIIHRDLKPSNILVRSDGSVRLLDFGIAKQIETLEASADRTMTGLRLMTPAYAAPEQISGARIGIQTDVYSLGVILYELLAGCLPFDLSTKTPGEAEAIILGQTPNRPSEVSRQNDTNTLGVSAGASAWADLDVLCLTAMHKDPSRRYQSVEALIRDVDHYLKGEPLEARPDSLRYRVRKYVRRNRASVAAVAAVAAVIVSLVIFFTLRLTRARNEAVAEAARTQRIQRFTLNLFQGGDESVGPADDLRVVTLLDRGVQEARALDSEPAMQAELYQTLGGIYQNLGKLDQADNLLRTSLERRKQIFGPEHPAVAESLVALGLLRDAQAQYEEAEKLVRDGFAMSERLLPAKHPAIAKATSSLGKVLEDRGEYDKAIQVLERAVGLQSSSSASKADFGASLSELANCHFYAGHYDISESLNQRAFEIDRRLYGERHPNVANDLINLGAIQQEKGNPVEAERYYRQALDIIVSFYGKDHQETASAQTMLGRALVSQNRLDEAADMLRGAVAIQEKVYGKVHPRVASALNELGRVALQSGKYDEAEVDFRRMADIYRSIYSNKHYYIGIALSNLGSVSTERKRYAEAERYLRDAIAMFQQTLSPGHLNFGITRVKLGRVLLRERRYQEAETESRTGLDILSKQAIPSIDWIQKGREDLILTYEALHQAEKAAKLQAPMSAGEETATAIRK
jgi:eukaryotic-like serine/threonine-protein kinase